MLSPREVAQQHEIPAPQCEVWLLLPDGSIQEVDELGKFDTEDEAEDAAEMLLVWLQRGQWSSVLERPDQEDTQWLLGMPLALRERRIDPSKLKVAIHDFAPRAPTCYCPTVYRDPADDDDDDGDDFDGDLDLDGTPLNTVHAEYECG